MEWTYGDPGAGDLACFEDAKKWLSDCILAISNARVGLKKVERPVPDVWKGVGAWAFAMAVKRRISELNNAKEALQSVSKALDAYVTEVERIKGVAKWVIMSRDAAAAIRDAPFMYSRENPPSDDEIARARQRIQENVTKYNNAISELNTLGLKRLEADRTFSTTTVEVLSETWGPSSYASIVPSVEEDFDRDGANQIVGELYWESFVGGVGPRTRFFLDGEAFTEALRQSDHIEAARFEIIKRIANGSNSFGSEGVYDRSISGNVFVLLNDGANVGTGGSIRNLPESFLGSYELDYKVNSIDKSGSANVTFTINNDTTIDSFTRNPLGGHLPWKDHLVAENQENGTWEAVHQTIVWTETIVIPEEMHWMRK